MYKVSIIIPVYNREKLIIQCLESIFNQTYNNKEIIIINDGSTDNSEKVILDYINKHKNVESIYKRQENKGAPAARNLGLKYATGDYVVFFDSDDIMDFKRIEKQINSIIQNKSDSSVCGYKVIQNNRTWLPKFKYTNPLRSLLSHKLMWSTQSWMYKREYLLKINGYDEKLSCYQDLDITFRYIFNNKPNISTVIEPLSFFNDYNSKDRIMSIMPSKKGISTKIYVYKKMYGSLNSKKQYLNTIILIKEYIPFLYFNNAFTKHKFDILSKENKFLFLIYASFIILMYHIYKMYRLIR